MGSDTVTYRVLKESPPAVGSSGGLKFCFVLYHATEYEFMATSYGAKLR